MTAQKKSKRSEKALVPKQEVLHPDAIFPPAPEIQFEVIYFETLPNTINSQLLDEIDRMDDGVRLYYGGNGVGSVEKKSLVKRGKTK